MKKKNKLSRIFHPWTEWECYKAGFYNTVAPEGMDAEQAKAVYLEFFDDLPRFAKAMERVMLEWPKSCEQFLTNPSFNKVAWLGQASVCLTTGVPSGFKSSYTLLKPEQQEAANQLAQDYYERWVEEKCTLQRT